MTRVAFKMKLHKGFEDEYKKRHDELWPEMEKAMSQRDVNMVIYLYDHLLFVYATAPSEEDWIALDRDPVTPRWDKYMTDVLDDGEDGKTFVNTLPQMFAFGEFLHT